jgi:hypothetical protein
MVKLSYSSHYQPCRGKRYNLFQNFNEKQFLFWNLLPTRDFLRQKPTKNLLNEINKSSTNTCRGGAAGNQASRKQQRLMFWFWVRVKEGLKRGSPSESRRFFEEAKK